MNRSKFLIVLLKEVMDSSLKIHTDGKKDVSYHITLDHWRDIVGDDDDLTILNMLDSYRLIEIEHIEYEDKPDEDEQEPEMTFFINLPMNERNVAVALLHEKMGLDVGKDTPFGPGEMRWRKNKLGL